MILIVDFQLCFTLFISNYIPTSYIIRYLNFYVKQHTCELKVYCIWYKIVLFLNIKKTQWIIKENFTNGVTYLLYTEKNFKVFLLLSLKRKKNVSFKIPVIGWLTFHFQKIVLTKNSMYHQKKILSKLKIYLFDIEKKMIKFLNCKFSSK